MKEALVIFGGNMEFENAKFLAQCAIAAEEWRRHMRILSYGAKTYPEALSRIDDEFMGEPKAMSELLAKFESMEHLSPEDEELEGELYHLLKLCNESEVRIKEDDATGSAR
jgi:hypothetical protein